MTVIRVSLILHHSNSPVPSMSGCQILSSCPSICILVVIVRILIFDTLRMAWLNPVQGDIVMYLKVLLTSEDSTWQ